MTEHADQVVLDYLSRANDVAHRYLLGDVGTGGVPPVLRLAGPVGACLLGWWLARAVGAKTVRITRTRARGRPRGR